MEKGRVRGPAEIFLEEPSGVFASQPLAGSGEASQRETGAGETGRALVNQATDDRAAIDSD